MPVEYNFLKIKTLILSTVSFASPLSTPFPLIINPLHSTLLGESEGTALRTHMDEEIEGKREKKTEQ